MHRPQRTLGIVEPCQHGARRGPGRPVESNRRHLVALDGEDFILQLKLDRLMVDRANHAAKIVERVLLAEDEHVLVGLCPQNCLPLFFQRGSDRAETDVFDGGCRQLELAGAQGIKRRRLGADRKRTRRDHRPVDQRDAHRVIIAGRLAGGRLRQLGQFGQGDGLAALAGIERQRLAAPIGENAAELAAIDRAGVEDRRIGRQEPCRCDRKHEVHFWSLSEPASRRKYCSTASR
ncbi:MAG: hypothetical protein ACOX1P_09985 [Thermoguttaceae bacterium]